MNRYLLTALLVLVPLRDTAPQADLVNVKLRVLLVDKDLNQKPVPFYVVAFRNQLKDASSAELKTDLDGKAEKQLAPGRYSIATPKPVELGGKRYSWSLEVQINGAEQRIDLTNDNAGIEDNAPIPASSGEGKSSTTAAGGDLSALFDRLKNSVVTVRSEAGGGSGFLVDPAGLFVTNNHVVQSSNYLAVQFDQKRKVPARLITFNADKDVAVLWVDPAAFREAVVAPLLPNEAASKVVVGQRVFTIGNPLGREKVLTTGVISKVEKDAITSDISINPGNSGGPLFTLDGQVAGITTARLRSLASIVPIENVRLLVEQARKEIVGGSRISLMPENFRWQYTLRLSIFSCATRMRWRRPAKQRSAPVPIHRRRSPQRARWKTRKTTAQCSWCEFARSSARSSRSVSRMDSCACGLFVAVRK